MHHRHLADAHVVEVLHLLRDAVAGAAHLAELVDLDAEHERDVVARDDGADAGRAERDSSATPHSGPTGQRAWLGSQSVEAHRAGDHVLDCLPVAEVGLGVEAPLNGAAVDGVDADQPQPALPGALDHVDLILVVQSAERVARVRAVGEIPVELLDDALLAIDGAAEELRDRVEPGAELQPAPDEAASAL